MWAARYAQALFDLASDQKQVAAVEADLKSLKAALRRQPRPAGPGGLAGVQRRGQGQGPGRHRREGASSTPTTMKFLGLLAANGRAVGAARR